MDSLTWGESSYKPGLTFRVSSSRCLVNCSIRLLTEAADLQVMMTTSSWQLDVLIFGLKTMTFRIVVIVSNSYFVESLIH